ncbi:MAG: OmpA family protein [Gallionella sp.]|nr:OmpA family protein [Gallionella sp.]
MKKNLYLPLALIAVSVLSACGTASAPQNAALNAAHESYNSARANPQVVSMAALELKEAGDTLTKADDAFSKGQGTDTVNHLAYMANQQAGIAQATASRKTAELAVTNAGAKRTEVRLEARTAEADAAKRQVAIAQETTDQQAAELAAASANAERDQELIAKQEMQLKELNAKKTERGLVITLGDVLFNTGKAQLKSGGIHNVQKLADFLKQYPKQKVLVEGHTDSTGSDTFNQGLSDRRASAVRMALIDKGIASDRITTRGYGEAYPVAGNDTAAGRQMNRRVEIILSDSNGNIVGR